LVEIVIALGIAGFCLVALLGLLPTSLKSAKNTTDQTGAATLLDSIAMDLRNTPVGNTNTPLYGITLTAVGTNPPTTNGTNIFFNEDGSMTNTKTALSTRYGVLLNQTNPNSTTTIVQIQIYWPPTISANSLQTASGILEDVVTINRR
jgi:uncharacterized protein (TIGR02598 family)